MCMVTGNSYKKCITVCTYAQFEHNTLYSIYINTVDLSIFCGAVQRLFCNIILPT